MPSIRPLPRSMTRRVVALLVPVALTSWLLPVSGASATVLINEFERTGTGMDRIELVNTRPDTTYDLNGWRLSGWDTR